jgi:catechol 2,3-dioxygenase
VSLPNPPAVAPFSITRFSHVVLNVRDLAQSRAFYERLLGLVASAQDGDRLYLRGVEEATHHCLVLQKASGTPSAERVGFRVASEEALDAARRAFDERGLPSTWVDAPFQGRTLNVSDVAGVPLELCASMPVERLLVLDEALHRGAAAARIDHVQLHVPKVAVWVDFHVSIGFRISEYATSSGRHDCPLLGAFPSRKGDLLDLVGAAGPGPLLHHVA